MRTRKCGVDYTDGRTSANTDTMLYVTLDVEGGKVSALQIPRDTYVGDDVKTGGSKKFNAVYGHGKMNGDIFMSTNDNKNNKTDIFENKPVWQALTIMAVPTIMSQLITLIYNVADT